MQEYSDNNGKFKVWQEHSVSHGFARNDIKDKEKENGRPLNTEEIHRMHRKKGVCKRCEAVCYRDREGYRCPRCGWTGNTITVSEYREGGYYK